MSDFTIPGAGSAGIDLLKPVAKPPAAGVDKARIEKTARDFETSFLSVMLGQMFEGVSTSEPFGGGQGETAFRSFMTEAFAKSMTQHGGIGLSKQISSELLKLQGAA
jgi:peptidoglycan hydrolase FlgJ